MKSKRTKIISDHLHSSRIYRDTDDSLKDEDNAAWIMKLGKRERKDWITVLQWMRIADRLLERDLLQKPTVEMSEDCYGFKNFMDDWQKLRLLGQMDGNSKFAFLFKDLKDLWVREKLTESDLRTWDLYLDSIARYIRPRGIIATMKDYEGALCGLSGSIFHAFPHKPKDHSEAVSALGTLDQFYNNLRDMYEDITRGVIYFPNSLLKKFGINRAELNQLVIKPDKRYVEMMEYLLSSFVPRVRSKVAPLLLTNTLHHSWNTMLQNILLRHSRIEYISRLYGFNVKKFNENYWKYVRKDLDPDISKRFRYFKSTLRIK